MPHYRLNKALRRVRSLWYGNRRFVQNRKLQEGLKLPVQSISHTLPSASCLKEMRDRIKPDFLRQLECCKPVSPKYFHSNVSVECQCIKSSIWEGWVPRKSNQARKGWPWAGSRDMTGSQIHLLLGFPYDSALPGDTCLHLMVCCPGLFSGEIHILFLPKQ